MTTTIIEAIDDPGLFGKMFSAPSWEPWRAFLHALYAIPMGDEHFALYRRATGRNAPPARPARYAELVVGRRGGKSRILALIATFMACVIDHGPHLSPGETGVVAIIARDRTQARVILSYIIGFIREIAMFSPLIEDELAETLRLTNGVVIEVHTASIGAPRGRTFLAVLCDETAFWPTGDSANPDVEVINAVRPGLSTIPYSLLLVASSPYAKRGILYTNYAKYYGVEDAPVLVWQGSTAEMNSNLVDDPLIAEMYAEDVERASAEFGATFRTDIVAFITREAVESVLAHGIIELPPGGGITYVAHVDPSGGSADSMTLALAHCNSEGIAILDAVREVKPPFSPDAVVEEFATLLKQYGISRVTGDAYAGEWPRERFAIHGITYDVSTRNTSTIYGEFLPALNGRRVQLLDVPRLIGQLVGLERRVARGGKDSIGHQPGSHDDLANAACGALVQVLSDRRPALVRKQDLLSEDGALPLPRRVRYVFAVIAVDEKTGSIAVIYAARNMPGLSPELLLLDFDVSALRGDIFASISERTRELARQCRANDCSIMVPATLYQHALAAVSAVNVIEIPETLIAEERLMSVGLHVSARRVRLCVPAAEKAETAPFVGALNIRAFENVDDALRRAAVLTIAMLDDNETLS